MKAVALALALLAGCADQAKLNLEDQTTLGDETLAEMACIKNYRGNRAKIDACRADTRRIFDERWAERLEGGTP